MRREAAEQSLHEFVRQAWSIVEPDREFRDNWHVRAICEHLEATARGEINKLLINVPPGCMKSLLTCVFWPCWVWATRPETRWLFASYSSVLSVRDSLKRRAIIESRWFRNNWGRRCKMAGDQNRKTRFENTARGWMMATQVQGAGTGEHPDFAVCDDPHSAQQADSDVQRQAAIDWWDGTISTRGISRGVRQVIIMQRLHKKDLSSHVLSQSGWTHICLPMEYEPGRMPPTPLGWTDTRTEPGELLWPALFHRDSVEQLKLVLGRRAAGQLQQRPTDASGFLFKLDQFKIVPAAPAFESGDKVGLYWDKAGTQDGGDWTAGVVLMIKPNGQIFVMDVTRGQWGIDQRNQVLELKSRLAASRWPKLRIWIEQEPGSGGKESAEFTIKQLAGLRVEAHRKSGSKLDCWEPWASQVNAGNVHLVEASWNDAFIQEHVDAPHGEHDDQIDAAAGCFSRLVAHKQRNLAAWLAAGAFS
jgi:predicted phage terminase large subunit-like protein